MSIHQASRINKRKHSIKPRPAAEPINKVVIGFDSEADTETDGRPMMFQFSMPYTTEEEVLLYEVPLRRNAGIRTFIEFIHFHCTEPSTLYLIYVWNLQYELTQLFHDLPEKVIHKNEFTIKQFHTVDPMYTYPWRCHVVNDKRQLVTFRKGNINVRLLDGMAFYKTSLDNAARMLNVGRKQELAKLDRSTFSRRDITDPDFIGYAKRDAYITRLIGEYIQTQHDFYQVKTTISAPHFASSIFKTQFLKTGVAAPSSQLEQAGLSSYHGGKNGFYLKGPSFFPHVYQYDITSAYPEAMKQLPDIEKATWTHVDEYIPHIHGLYKISGTLHSCKYGSVQDHDGSWLDSGNLSDLWITSYELDEAISKGEVQLTRASGYRMDGPDGGALAAYVDKFFLIKRNAKGPEREWAKLLLNSLYGKFFQKQGLGAVGTLDIDKQQWVESDPSRPYDYEAGGLYHPPIASLITGFVRAKIHRLEHRYESVMTSTDGFFGLQPPLDSDKSTDLGGLTCTTGSLGIWRERLYIFDGDDGQRKYALHGFHGKVSDLESIPLAKGTYTYEGTQMITLKMSTQDIRDNSYSPGQFAKLTFTLEL